eukprot:g4260.t1
MLRQRKCPEATSRLSQPHQEHDPIRTTPTLNDPGKWKGGRPMSPLEEVEIAVRVHGRTRDGTNSVCPMETAINWSGPDDILKVGSSMYLRTSTAKIPYIRETFVTQKDREGPDSWEDFCEDVEAGRSARISMTGANHEEFLQCVSNILGLQAYEMFCTRVLKFCRVSNPHPQEEPNPSQLARAIGPELFWNTRWMVNLAHRFMEETRNTNIPKLTPNSFARLRLADSVSSLLFSTVRSYLEVSYVPCRQISEMVTLIYGAVTNHLEDVYQSHRAIENNFRQVPARHSSRLSGSQSVFDVSLATQTSARAERGTGAWFGRLPDTSSPPTVGAPGYGSPAAEPTGTNQSATARRLHLGNDSEAPGTHIPKKKKQRTDSTYPLGSETHQRVRDRPNASLAPSPSLSSSSSSSSSSSAGSSASEESEDDGAPPAPVKNMTSVHITTDAALANLYNDFNLLSPEQRETLLKQWQMNINVVLKAKSAAEKAKKLASQRGTTSQSSAAVEPQPSEDEGSESEAEDDNLRRRRPPSPTGSTTAETSPEDE